MIFIVWQCLWWICSVLNFACLTPWRLGDFGDFRKKNSSFRLPYQCPSSSANCTRELFKGSNGSASPVDCTQNKIFCLGGWVFCEWRHCKPEENCKPENRFPIKNLLIDSLLTPIVESTHLSRDMCKFESLQKD